MKWWDAELDDFDGSGFAGTAMTDPSGAAAMSLGSVNGTYSLPGQIARFAVYHPTTLDMSDTSDFLAECRRRYRALGFEPGQPITYPAGPDALETVFTLDGTEADPEFIFRGADFHPNEANSNIAYMHPAHGWESTPGAYTGALLAQAGTPIATLIDGPFADGQKVASLNATTTGEYFQSGEAVFGDVATEDFVLEFILRMDSVSQTTTLVSKSQHATIQGWSLLTNGTQVYLNVRDAGAGALIPILHSAADFTEWQHVVIAIDRSGNGHAWCGEAGLQSGVAVTGLALTLTTALPLTIGDYAGTSHARSNFNIAHTAMFKPSNLDLSTDTTVADFVAACELRYQLLGGVPGLTIDASLAAAAKGPASISDNLTYDGVDYSPLYIFNGEDFDESALTWPEKNAGVTLQDVGASTTPITAATPFTDGSTAVRFRAGNRLEAPNNTFGDLGGEVSYIMELICRKDTTTSLVPVAKKFGSGASNAGYYVDLGGSATRMYLSDGTSNELPKDDGTQDLQKWVHIAFAIDVTNDATDIWINGDLQTVSTEYAGGLSTFANTDRRFTIGGLPQAALQFDGEIARVAMYKVSGLDLTDSGVDLKAAMDARYVQLGFTPGTDIE